MDDILVTDVRNLPQLAPDYVIPGQKYRWYTSFNPIVAELHRQRMFCKKKRMSKALSVQKKIAHGRTDQTDRHTIKLLHLHPGNALHYSFISLRLLTAPLMSTTVWDKYRFSIDVK